MSRPATLPPLLIVIENSLRAAVVGRVVDAWFPPAPDDVDPAPSKALVWPAFWPTGRSSDSAADRVLRSFQDRQQGHPPNEADTQTGARDGSHSR